MTKEQEEAISRLRKITNRQILYGNKFGITIEGFRELQEDLETVLNMIKEKNTEIEKYKKLLADNLAKNLNDSIKAKEKADTDLDDLDKGWKVELEKKDKMIDLTLEFLAERDLGYYQKEEGGEIQGIFRKYNKDDWKQYFERKEENV